MLYTDYVWKEGIPKGIAGPQPRYEIITDPYGKRYLILDQNHQLIYDSNVIDFRHLNPRHQQGWSRDALNEDQFLVRDRDHFPLFIEHHFFKEGLPIECKFYSLSRVLIAVQKIHYVHLGEANNSVTLCDIEGKPILKKEYVVNDQLEFTTLLSTTF